VRVLAIDTETNAMDPRDPGNDFKLLGVSTSFEGVSEYFPLGHLAHNYSFWAVKQSVQRLVSDADVVVFHNAKFDLPVLQRGLDLDLWKTNWYCTLLMAHFLDENLAYRGGYGLDNLASTYLGKNKVKDPSMRDFIDGPGWAFVPVWMIAPYAKQDADLTKELFLYLYDSFRRSGFDKEIWDVEKKFLRAVASMEQVGVRVDAELSHREIALGQDRMSSIVADMDGTKPSSPKALEKLLVVDLGLPVVKLTPKGSPCFDKYAMEEYDILLQHQDSNLARNILEYRGYQKALSTYFSAFLRERGTDGRVRPNFKLHGTVTGRLSCSSPNFQQIPKVTNERKRWNLNTKKALIPTDGYRLWEFDYSNIELRLAAAYANETSLLKAFNAGDNIWEVMMERLGWDKNTTKTFTYATLYGGGDKRISVLFDITVKEARAKRSEFFDHYPKLQRVTRSAEDIVTRYGEIQLWTGRVRHFEHPDKDKHKAFNSVVQGGGAEIVKRSVVACHGEYKESDECRMVLTVHDSICFEIKVGHESVHIPRITAIMEDTPAKLGVRFQASCHEWGSE
jgi:DNA polymerase I